MRRLAVWLMLLCAGVMAPAQPVAAQGFLLGSPSPVRTIDQERLFADSAFGRRVLAELEAASRRLAAENARLQGELTAEELALTQQRATLDPAEFRDLADAFDARVTRIRAEQEEAARAITLRRDTERARFYEAVAPLLVQLMRETGTVAILDVRTVIIAAEGLDLTDLALRLADARLGDGTSPVPDAAPDPAAPPQ